MFPNFFKLIQNRSLILLGFLISVIFIYYRFLRGRFPRDIPFHLSPYGFFIIIYVICIYIFIVFMFIRPPKQANESIQLIINWLYTPLTDFDTYFKNISFIKPYYYRIIIWLAYKLEYLFKHNYFDYIFYIFPRVILITALLIDIFWFGQLYYIYKVLLIGVFLVLRRYLLFAFKQSKIDLINDLLLDVDSVTLRSIPGVEPVYPQDEDDDEEEDEYDSSLSMGLPVDIFITFWTRFKVYQNFMDFYPHPVNSAIAMLTDLSEHFRNRLILAKLPYRPFVNETCYYKFNKHVPNFYRDLLTQKLTDTVQVSVILEHKGNNDIDKRLKYSKALVFSFYVICWSYILFISFHTLDIDALFTFIFNIITSIKPPSNPFL